MSNPFRVLARSARRKRRRLSAKFRGIYSNFDEQILIQRYVSELGVRERFCVDIAAGDGISMSNSYALFREGWHGLAVEYGSARFAKLARTYRQFPGAQLARCKVTPDTVVPLLQAHAVPSEFGFLSLDIDSYDFFVLERLLGAFRPALICAEVNEKIPPPVKFTVKWSPAFTWKADHLFGQSLSQLCTLCPVFGYSLVALHFNNAFLVPSELSPYPALTPEDAYRQGYVEQPGRTDRFPWNADVDVLTTLSPSEAVAFIRRFFAGREDEFTCGV